jgi:predicted site-specific integrase-resolvase
MTGRTELANNSSMERVWNSRETAEYLHVSVKTLEAWRQDGSGPPFVRYSSRCVRYRPEQVERWMLSRETAAN